MAFLVVLLVVVFSYTLFQVSVSILGLGKPKNLPPGPYPLPIIGNLHMIGSQPHRSLANLAQTHGPIMLLKLGQNTTLVISSASAAKQVLQKHDLSFATHFMPAALDIRSYSTYSLGLLPVDNQWRFVRKIINSNLFSVKSLEASKHLRDQKVEELISYCHNAGLSNEHVDIGSAAFRTLLNLICNNIFSKDFTDPYNDSGKEFREVIGNIMVDAAKPNLVDFFPMLKKIDPQGLKRRMSSHFDKVLAILEDLIEERLAMGTSEHHDLLDVFLKINQDNPQEFSRSCFKILILDMFIAGTDTTSTTVEWAMAEVLRNPHIMAKSKEELEHVIGKGKIIREDDIIKLPYLSCIVKETFRLHPPAPFLLPRNVENQVEVNGYVIPKGIKMIVNAWAIGQDTTIWDDSKEFKPERFLGREIDVRGQNFELIPFGAGRRICPGLPLALRTIPVMLGSLLNNFDWNLDVNMDMTERFGITLQKANPLSVVPILLN
ncbi:hypothetical protein R6Q59_025356 [Mikania micrantha]